MDQIKDLLPIISALVALSVALVKILEVLVGFLVKKLSKTKTESELLKDVVTFLSDKTTSTLSDEERFILKELHRILSKSDEHGVPLCYASREVAESQKEIVAILNRISSYQEKTAILLEYSIDKLDHLDQHHDNKATRR